MKRLSWKYIAGFVDGEGCIDFQCHVDRRNKVKRLYIVPRLRISLIASCRFILENFHANFGGYFHKIRDFDNPNWQAAVTWQIQGKKMRPILQNIVKHLLIKKEQAKFAIWWVDNVMGKQTPNGFYDERLQKIRECARDELKAMKKDPQRLSDRAVQNILALMR